MARVKNLCGMLVLACMMLSPAQGEDLSAVRRVTVVSQNPLQLQIQTNSKAVPQTMLISGPDRLVIDIPNSVQGPGLRNLSVNREAVKGVRVSQYSAMPPVTRIVVDLSAPQTYSVVPNPAGLLVNLTSESATASGAQANGVIGWVSGKSTVKVVNAVASSSAGKAILRPALAANSVSVQFADGLLSIQATGATLSQVLFEIQKQTGAEIAIPAGAEQDRVAANFGPGPAGQVLGDLLNGSGLNFVVVGSESDPRALRSVLLSPKSDQPGGAVALAQPYSAPEAEDIPPQGQEDLTPPDSNPVPPDNNVPQQQAVPGPSDTGTPAPPQ